MMQIVQGAHEGGNTEMVSSSLICTDNDKDYKSMTKMMLMMPMMMIMPMMMSMMMIMMMLPRWANVFLFFSVLFTLFLASNVIVLKVHIIITIILLVLLIINHQ